MAAPVSGALRLGYANLSVEGKPQLKKVGIAVKVRNASDFSGFTHAGIDPRRKKYLLIKSPQHFRAGFEPNVEHIVMVDGPCDFGSDYALFPFNNLQRPIYLLDPETRR